IPLASGSETRLGQVFLNLIVNAAQAIPAGNASGNTITVRTELTTPDTITVTVADTGVGIPADKLARAFDPFISTKTAGVGTGRALARSHRLISELGVTIAVHSTVVKCT